MIKYIVYEISSGRIIYWGESTLSSVEAMNADEGQEVLIISETATPDTHYVLDKGLVAKPPKPTEHHKFNYDTKEWEADKVRCLNLLRRERDGLLFRCDWTQVTDCKLSDSKIAEWASYRQELRDLPEKYNNIESLSEVIFPNPPA